MWRKNQITPYSTSGLVTRLRNGTQGLIRNAVRRHKPAALDRHKCIPVMQTYKAGLNASRSEHPSSSTSRGSVTFESDQHNSDTKKKRYLSCEDGLSENKRLRHESSKRSARIDPTGPEDNAASGQPCPRGPHGSGIHLPDAAIRERMNSATAQTGTAAPRYNNGALRARELHIGATTAGRSSLGALVVTSLAPETVVPNPASPIPLGSSTALADEALDNAQPRTPDPSEPQLCPEQERLVDLIVGGRNVFYTGSAGCGKSTVLRAFASRLKLLGKRVRIIAPTGRAALQVGGQTTWTYAGWTPDSHKRTLNELRRAAHGKNVWTRFNETDVLVIDEISMVENHHFERLNEVMKEARFNPSVNVQPAFGGVQLVVTGDFCQLPPVKPFQHCLQCGKELRESYSHGSKLYTCRDHGSFRDEDKWAFKSKAWGECHFVHVHLRTIHRQSDETFIRMLQKCRLGEQFLPQEVDLLMNHKCNVQNATQLFATREEANRVNLAAFDKLKSEKHTYWCLDTLKFESEKHHHLEWKSQRRPVGPESQQPLEALKEHRFEELVQLKRGMLVVLLVNLDLELGLCNGSQGLVCDFELYNPARMPKAKFRQNDDKDTRLYGDRAQMKAEQIQLFIEGAGASHKLWPVVKFLNGQTRTIFAVCSITELGDERPYSLLCRTQIPLAPAWAMTIHKSQSLTFDRVIVNLSKAFEEGQVYVALSRATSLEGLKIEGDRKGLLAGLGGNKEVQAFLREKFGTLDTQRP